jgi:hypothetical protein
MSDTQARLHAIRAVMPPRGTPHHEMPAYMQRDQQSTNAAHTALDALAAELERVTAALREAREGFVEAYEYGCQWPIGLDTDPQEQRGMDRDVFLRNCEFLIERIDAALTDVARAAQEDK